MAKLTLRLSTESSADDIRVVLAILKLNQEDLSKEFEVSTAAISLAIKNDPSVKKLRERIIEYLNTLQFNGGGK